MSTLTKSELMQAAHKIAKAYQVKMGGGDYIVYLQFALKAVHEKSNINAETIKQGVNKLLRLTGLTCFFTKAKSVKCTHGLVEVEREWELKNITLKDGQFFGEKFAKNGKTCAWIRSVKTEQVAY